MTTIAAPDGSAEAYVARPEGASGPLPGIIFYIDAIGLRPQIAAMADRIASWGYLVLAPNLFYRDGTAAETTPTEPLTTPAARDAFFQKFGARIGQYTVERSLPDTASWVAALDQLTGAGAAPIGVTGYCMGARLATQAAGACGDRVVAVGGFHGGGLVTDDPHSPHLSLAQARAEFVYGHADQDPSMPPEAVAALGATLAEHGLTATNEIYPGAAHGYTMADTAVYHEASAERHFRELQGLFARTLGTAV